MPNSEAMACPGFNMTRAGLANGTGFANDISQGACD